MARALRPPHPLCAQCASAAAPHGGLAALACSPKLLALQQILHECGIGLGQASASSGEGGGEEGGGLIEGGIEGAVEGPVATHRALVFSQSGALLDLVESQVVAR